MKFRRPNTILPRANMISSATLSTKQAKKMEANHWKVNAANATGIILEQMEVPHAWSVTWKIATKRRTMSANPKTTKTIQYRQLQSQIVSSPQLIQRSPPASVESERVFSTLGNIYTDKRAIVWVRIMLTCNCFSLTFTRNNIYVWIYVNFKFVIKIFGIWYLVWKSIFVASLGLTIPRHYD